MNFKSLIAFGISSVCLLGSCTERRTDSRPVPDGDTVEVVIHPVTPEKKIRIIDVNYEDSAENLPQTQDSTTLLN